MYTPSAQAARDVAPTIASPLSTTITIPPSAGKTGWEREETMPTTPTPFFTSNATTSSHQHSSSLFEFFRGRKASIPKSSAAHHQAAAAAAVAAASAASATSFVPLPMPLPLKGTPPMISKSRLGSSTAPIPPPIRKQSLDVSQFSGYHNNPLQRAQQHERHAATMPIFPSSSSAPSISITASDPKANGVAKGYHQDPSPMTPTPNSFNFPLPSTPTSDSPSPAPHQQQYHVQPPRQQSQTQHQPHHNTIASSFTKVAAAVVGATVGKRRPSVSSSLYSELGSGSGSVSHSVKETGQQQPAVAPIPGQYSKRSPMTTLGLDQEKLNQHVRFMKSEKSATEMAVYADRLYYTVVNKDVALDYSKKQISVLQKELDQTRAQAEESKKALIVEVDRVKDQVVTMEENFLLWRTKVHNDQMAQQEDYLHERLIKQDRIEELEDDLNSAQEEVTRLRNRLVTLEYEDGWVGSSSFLSINVNNNNESSSSASSFTSSPNDYQTSDSQRNHYPDSTTIDFGPMTVATHKRRSQDFHILELKAQSFEGQVQELMRVLELERQDRQKDFTEFKMRMQAQCSKLEQEAQAAKMESTMYNEMMHEVVTENDDLRKQIKHVKRNSKFQSQSNRNSNSNNNYNGKHSIYDNNANDSNSNSSSSSFSTRDDSRRRQDDYFGYPSSEFDGHRSDSLYGSEDEMEEIAI